MEQNTSDSHSEFVYTADTAILYAIGIGECSKLDYLYECSHQFSIYPTFCILPSIKALIDFDTHTSSLAERNISFDVSRLLHGEQFIEFYRPLPVNQNRLYTKQPHLVEVLDKGSATLVITENNTYTQDQQLLCRNQVSCMILGSGGWKGPRQPESNRIENIVKPPERDPDHVVIQKINENQAALYRLCGDKNPLHIDPMFAKLAGYSKPILHGLCSLGFAVRHVMDCYPDRPIKRIKTRFSGVIYPGETIVTEIWLEGSRAHFQCINKESGKTILLGSYLDFE